MDDSIRYKVWWITAGIAVLAFITQAAQGQWVAGLGWIAAAFNAGLIASGNAPSKR